MCGLAFWQHKFLHTHQSFFRNFFSLEFRPRNIFLKTYSTIQLTFMIYDSGTTNSSAAQCAAGLGGRSLEMQSIFSFFILLKCTKLHSHSKFLHKKRNRGIIMQIVQRGWSHDRASLRGFVCTKFFSLFRLHQRKLSSLIINITLSRLVVVLYLSQDHLIFFWCSTE